MLQCSVVLSALITQLLGNLLWLAPLLITVMGQLLERSSLAQ
jgi:hypothetical protein